MQHKMTRSLFDRIFGEKGLEFQELVGATIRSVTFGIIGVALIQSAFAALGFLVVGLPAFGLWAVVFLIAAVLQFGVVVLIPVLFQFLPPGEKTALVSHRPGPCSLQAGVFGKPL